MARSGPTVPLLTAVLLLTGAAACGSNHVAATPAGPTSATSPPPPITPAATMTSPAPHNSACPDGPVTVTHNPGDTRSRTACARSGATVTITLLPARGFRWEPVQSSNPDVANVVETHVDADGTGRAVIRAGRPGTAAITTSDTYTPDRFGPPTRLWTLGLEVR